MRYTNDPDFKRGGEYEEEEEITRENANESATRKRKGL